jgi:hypothetical protein
MKFLFCLGRQIPIVSVKWIDACRESHSLVDPMQYILVDVEAEKKYGFKIIDSINKRHGNGQGMLTGRYIHVSDLVKPDPKEMCDIVEACGGTYVPDISRSTKPTIVIATPQDASTFTKFSNVQAIVSSEFILTG